MAPELLHLFDDETSLIRRYFHSPLSVGLERFHCNMYTYVYLYNIGICVYVYLHVRMCCNDLFTFRTALLCVSLPPVVMSGT